VCSLAAARSFASARAATRRSGGKPSQALSSMPGTQTVNGSPICRSSSARRGLAEANM
jgi:hypothetical protein